MPWLVLKYLAHAWNIFHPWCRYWTHFKLIIVFWRQITYGVIYKRIATWLVSSLIRQSRGGQGESQEASPPALPTLQTNRRLSAAPRGFPWLGRKYVQIFISVGCINMAQTDRSLLPLRLPCCAITPMRIPLVNHLNHPSFCESASLLPFHSDQDDKIWS